MSNRSLMNLGGPDRYVKKVGDQWRYYPKTVAIEEYYLEIKPGKEHEVKETISGTVRFLVGMSSVLVGAMILADRGFIWGFVFCCFFYPYKVYKRVKSIELFCNDCGCSKPKFSNYYFKLVNSRMDENDWGTFFLFLFIFVVSAGVGYINFLSKDYLKTILCMIPLLATGIALSLFVFKRYRKV